MGQELVEAALEDYESAPIDTRLREMLRFLEKMTLHPEELSHDDGRRLRDAGLSEQAIVDAISIGFAFNVIDRLADAFDFDVPAAADFARSAPTSFRIGYKL